MFLGTEASLRWRRRAWLAGAGVVLSYLLYAWRSEFTHGGSFIGQAYGYLALVMILVLVYYAVRKRSYRSQRGNLEDWAQAHVYLGLIVVLVVLCHTGFRFQDKLAVSALLAMILVSLSGVVGVIFYTTVPRLLTTVGTEPPADEIAHDIEQARQRMERLARGRSRAFLEVLRHLEGTQRPIPFAGWRMLGRNPLAQESDAELKPLLAAVPSEEQEDLKRLLVQSRQIGELHRRLAAQQRYRNLLQVWLYVHVPMTVALLVLVLSHLVAVTFFT